MWIRITKSCNQGLNTYSKGELIDRPESQIKLLPKDVYEPAAAPWETQVDQAARVRDQKKQTFLRLQQESILAADKLRTAVGIAANRRQSLYVTQNALEKLITVRTNCQMLIKKFKSNTTKKGQATFAQQTAQLETINKEKTLMGLMVAKLTGQVQASDAEADLQTIFAENARLATAKAEADLRSLIDDAAAKQEQSSDEQQPKQNEPDAETAPTDNADPAAQPEDADNPQGQTVSA